MKLEDFAYAVAQRVFEELTHKHHFQVPDKIREAVLQSIRENLKDIIR